MKPHITKCQLCHREIPLTFHHLIPRTLHSTKWYRNNFSKEQLQSGIYVCPECHNTLHKFIPEKEMGRIYNTLEKIKEHEKVMTFVQWVGKRKR